MEPSSHSFHLKARAATFAVRLFYSLALIVVARLFFRHHHVKEMMTILSENPSSLYYFYLSSCVLGLLSAGCAIWKVSWRVPKIVVGICLLFSAGVLFELNLVGNNLHAWVWCSVFMCLLSKADKGQPWISQWQWVFGATQLLFVSFYTVAGIWKMIHLFECFWFADVICQIDKNIFSLLMARESINYPQYAPLWEFVFARPWLGAIGFYGVILFQLSGLYFWWNKSLHGLFGVIAIVFHQLNIAIMGVNFSYMAIAIIPIFIFSPLSKPSLNDQLIGNFKRQVWAILAVVGMSIFTIKLVAIWEKLETVPGISLFMCFWMGIIALALLWKRPWLFYSCGAISLLLSATIYI